MNQDFAAGREAGMLPSAALNRFVPPRDLLWDEKQQFQERSRYGFCAAGFNLLIRPQTGSEVLRQPAVSSFPGSAPWLLGMMNLRGNLVPVFDLSIALGSPAARAGTPNHAVSAGAAAFVLVLDKGENALGLCISGFPQALLGLRQVTRLPQLPERLQEHVSAAWLQEERIWLDFNHESFFDKLRTTTV